MPYVNIKVTGEGTAPDPSSTTPEQKAALIKGVSDLLFEVLGKPHNATMVVIDEVELENWGVGSNSVAKAICRTNANHARTLALLKTKLGHKYTADPNPSISSRDRPCFARGKPFKHLEAECSRS